MKLEKGSGEFPLISEGEHVLKFEGIEDKRITSKFPDGKLDDGKANVYLWRFVSTSKTDERGVAEVVEVMTDTKITPNNNTAKFIRILNPKWDFATDDFDPDEYQGRLFKSYIVHQTTPGGKIVAKIVKMSPVAVAEPAAVLDPFAD